MSQQHPDNRSETPLHPQTTAGYQAAQQSEEFSRLLAVSKRIIAELDLPKVYALVAESAREIVQAELVVLPVLNAARDQYTYVEASGEDADSVRGATFAAHIGMCGWVLQHERSLLFGEVSSYVMDEQTQWEEGQQSAVLVPLMGRAGIIGGLSALGKRGGGCFTQHDHDLLTMFANQVSTAIENAKLFQQVTQEVEERRRTETALRESEARLKEERDFTAAVVDTVAAIVVVLDREGRIVRFNRACEEVSGYAAGEAVGRFVWDFLIPPEQVAGVKDVFRNLTAGMFPNRYENYWVAKNGERRLIAWSNTALLAQDGTVAYVIPTGIDITERRRVEQAVLEEKKFSDTIIDSLPGVFYICDEQGRLVRWNNNEKEVTGYTVNELMGMSVLQLFREDRELIVNKIGEVFANGRASVEARLVTKGGTAIPFFLSAFRMVTQGRTYLVGVGIDISERKRLEEQLRQSQKMESIGTLAGGIAHDFNNILTAIIGYANLLQMKMKEDDPLRHSVEQILASSNRAASLTQGLLAYSRKQVLNPRPVRINDIIKKVEHLLARLIGEDVELKTILCSNEDMVHADAGQIEQVLMNLATNARDAMPEGGCLFIETEVVDIDAAQAQLLDLRKAGRYVLITVTDSGHGMDEHTRERIFEPFFTTKEAGKGTGLGLAMAYGIVTQHGGAIHVESDAGRGSVFKIHLPVDEVRPDEATPVELPPIEGGTETILVAEDDEAVRTLTANILEQFGYSVVQAVDGEDAVNKFMANRDRVRLLFFDVIMPKKNGKEAYDKIRIFAPNVKALFCSGYTADIIRQKGLLDEGLHFILKPVPMNELLRNIRMILDS